MKVALIQKKQTLTIYVVLMVLACLVVTAGTCLSQVSFDINIPAENAEVGQSTVVSGSARISSDQHLWVLVSPGSHGELWWPIGEAQVDSNNQGDRLWTLRVNLGGPEDRGEFRIAVVVVDSREHQQLEDYLRQTSGKAGYGPQPIVMPQLSTSPQFRRVIRR